MLHFDHTARPRCGRRSLRDDGTKARANSFVAAMPPHPGCAAPKHSLNPPLKKEGRRSAKRRTVRATSCDAARAFAPSFPKLEKTGAPGTPLEQGALAFRRPTAVLTKGFTPRLGPGRASWNHRMQTGGPSPAPVQRAPRSPITRRTGRCPDRPLMQCMAALTGPPPLRLKEYPREKRPSRAGHWAYNPIPDGRHEIGLNKSDAFSSLRGANGPARSRAVR